MIKFYYLSGSPFSWRIWLALEHRRAEYELVPVSVDAGDLRSPEFREISPRGRAPVLVDGPFALTESPAIIEYLEDENVGSGPSLWPGASRQRAVGRRMQSEVDSYLYPVVRKLVEEIVLRKEGQPDQTLIDRALREAKSNLQLFSAGLSATFLVGDTPSAADYALYPLTAILLRVGARRDDMDLADLIPPPLVRWQARVEALPFFEHTFPPHWRAE